MRIKNPYREPEGELVLHSSMKMCWNPADCVVDVGQSACSAQIVKWVLWKWNALRALEETDLHSPLPLARVLRSLLLLPCSPEPGSLDE